MNLPELREDRKALAIQVLNHVQKNGHNAAGRERLEPFTIKITAENPHHIGLVVGSASFLCFPFFDHNLPPREQTEANALAKPSRFLCQLRLHLGNLLRQGGRRDVGSGPESNAGFFVSQIWALIIDDSMSGFTASPKLLADNTKLDVLLTCAPARSTVLCGDSIRHNLKLQARLDVRLDVQRWPIRFRSLRGSLSSIPVRHCRTWSVSRNSQMIATIMQTDD